MKALNKQAIQIQEILTMTSKLVGVKFISNSDTLPARGKTLNNHRYCQALMKARHGEHVILSAEGIACPAAAAAFGFKKLPEGLSSGKGLVGFGIVTDENTGQAMFRGMETLPLGELKALYLFPIESATQKPDIVVAEDVTEKLMWIALAYLNVKGGKRIESSTAILQATCVDATIIPFVQQRLNMSMGCYGCRDATDIGHNETVLGFPYTDFEGIFETLEYLNQKAIPNSRGKNALAMLKQKEAEIIEQHDPFQKPNE